MNGPEIEKKHSELDEKILNAVADSLIHHYDHHFIDTEGKKVEKVDTINPFFEDVIKRMLENES